MMEWENDIKLWLVLSLLKLWVNSHPVYVLYVLSSKTPGSLKLTKAGLVPVFC